MDSLSQFVLGASVAVATLGRRTPIWKAALWGGACGTLPDLDVVFDHGDPVRNMTLHRADSHSLFWLTLAGPALGALAARLLASRPADAPDTVRSTRLAWMLATWLALVTHPLLDWTTVYGTQLWRPFTDQAFAIGSMFIIDPLYTVPLLVGLALALGLRNGSAGLRANRVGLIASTGYLAWSALAQAHVHSVAQQSLPMGPDTAAGSATRILVTPAPFNTVLWRVVAVTPTAYRHGSYSLLDRHRAVQWDAPRERRPDLADALAGHDPVARLSRFTQGFYKMSEDAAGRVYITDLRMGWEPVYTFRFLVGQRNSPTVSAVPPRARADNAFSDFGAVLHWLWRRAGGDVAAPLPAAGPTQ